MKNIVGDILQRPALHGCHVALMDIDAERLADAETIASGLVGRFGADATVSAHLSQREALDGADFVIVAFHIGGYRPGTLIDFDIPKRYGLRQTIADTLGVGGIMRGLRTVPWLFRLCEDMSQLCPDALLLQYVNPMAINCWAIAEKYPEIRSVGLCHSVQGTVEELARDLEIPAGRIRYRCAGINHMAFYLELEEILENGSCRDLYPDLAAGYTAGRIPKPNPYHARCPNLVRYEVMTRLGHFVTESSEHFSEYVPWFIKEGRGDLLDRFGIPLDEYCARCEEQAERWEEEFRAMRDGDDAIPSLTNEYASEIVNAIWTGTPAVIHGNVPNRNLIDSLPPGCIVEVPCLVDRNGIQPVRIGVLPPQLAALMRTNINVQELTVEAILRERRDHVYHAAMLDPHTAAELDLDQIWSLVDDLIEAHGSWMPDWLIGTERPRIA